MRKILGLIVVLAMILSLCGCGNGKAVPTDSFVMERLKTISTISDMAAVTEDHDPNGQLNKQGGYIGCIYFRDTRVNWDELYLDEGEDNVIDVGTDGGGSIEIYKTAKEAKERDEYLAQFDGGAFSSGSHQVQDTMVIRTSSYLKASEQKELTDQIIQALK